MKYSRYGNSRSQRHTRRKARVRARLAAAIIRGLAVLVLLAISVTGIRWLSGGVPTHTDASYHSLSTGVPSFSSLAGPRPAETQTRNRRLVYPYSIVPGGVESAKELHEAAAHDSTVAQHYSGFDYDRARLIEVKQARLVYLSYRRGDKVYWTRKQVSLHPGEKILTDGKIAARTRCANQVSVLPRADTLPEEPQQAELDRPDAVASGFDPPPGSLDSNLFHVNPVLPTGPSSVGGGTFSGSTGGLPSGFIPLPTSGPGGGTSKPPGGGSGGGGGGSGGGGGGGGSGGGGGGGGGGGCTGKNCNPPPPVPEPGTAILLLSGVAAVATKLRFGKR